jgi:hypothetical protein
MHDVYERQTATMEDLMNQLRFERAAYRSLEKDYENKKKNDKKKSSKRESKRIGKKISSPKRARSESDEPAAAQPFNIVFGPDPPTPPPTKKRSTKV